MANESSAGAAATPLNRVLIKLTAFIEIGPFTTLTHKHAEKILTHIHLSSGAGI